MARSETILGRRHTREAFIEAKEHGLCFAVTCYRTRKGKIFYADPSYFGSRSGLQKRQLPPIRGLPGLPMRYRIIVTPKRDKQR